MKNAQFRDGDRIRFQFGRPAIEAGDSSEFPDTFGLERLPTGPALQPLFTCLLRGRRLGSRPARDLRNPRDPRVLRVLPPGVAILVFRLRPRDVLSLQAITAHGACMIFGGKPAHRLPAVAHHLVGRAGAPNEGGSARVRSGFSRRVVWPFLIVRLARRLGASPRRGLRPRQNQAKHKS